MQKFGYNILAVVQRYDVLKASEVRGAMIGCFQSASWNPQAASSHRCALTADSSFRIELANR